MHINKVIVSGRLAGGASTTFTERGVQSASFALLVEEQGQGEQVFRTYVPCIAYGKVAEKVGELSRGDALLIDGKLAWRAASKDGQKPGRIEVFCTSVEVEPQPSMAAVNEN